MKTLNPQQKRIIYLALMELAQKQERILEQHAFDPDIEGELEESQAILDDIGSLIYLFSNTTRPSHLIDDETMERLQKSIAFGETSYANKDGNYPKMAGALMSVVDNFKIYLKDYSK